MNAVADAIAPSKLALFGAAVIVGSSIATMASGEQVALPAVGPTPSLAVGGVGLVVGLGLYTGVKRYTAGCGCGDDCGC